MSKRAQAGTESRSKPDTRRCGQEEGEDTNPEMDRGFTVTHGHIMHPKEAVMKVSHCLNWRGN